MKKFTKLVGILLTLAMVLSMVPATVVGAVSAGTTGTGEIVQGRVLNIYPATNITTVFGYYSDGTGADESTFVDGNDGECVTDGWFGRAGYSECTPADGLVALVMTLSEPIDLGGMEMISHGDDYSPTSFDVQAYVDGAWVTVYTQSSNAFTSNLTQMFDFGTSTTTSKVRVLIYGTKANGECRFKEVTLYEASTGNQYEFIDLTGRGSSADQNAANPVGNLVNQDKSDIFLASIATFDLTNNGQPTTVDGFNLGAYRVDSNPFPSTVTVEIKKTAGGEYESIGTYSTGWSTGSVADTLVVNFDQSYDAYGIRFSFDKWSYMNVLELFQFTRETTQAPTEPAPTEPAPGDYIKIDLTNSNLIGGCSGSYAARDVSTSTNFDAISWFFNKSSEFERIEGLVDGNTTSTYGEWGMDPNEGADFYLKLDSATAIDQIRLYSYTYDSRYAMPQNFKVFLVLQDGSAVEKSFTTGWSSSTANGTPCTFDLGQTYTVTGVYVLSTTNTPAYQDAGKFSLAEVELYQKQVPVDPNAPVIEKVTGLAPEFGYYTDGTTGAITPYYQSGREPGFLIDGDSSTQTRSDYYLHEDITTNAKTPVILFELGETKVLTSIKIEGYQYERYNMEDFEIQVSNSTGADNWVTVATVEDAFRDGANGDDVAPMSIDLGGVSANKIRILISGITDMSAEMEDETDTELLLGGYIRVKEITLFQNTNATPEEPTEPDVQLSAPTGLTATVTDSTITATADTVEGGTLMFRINGGEWQASGEFTGLNRNTTYTIEAMYVGAEGYIDSAVATIEATTAKTALTAPTGLAATTTDSTITATADAIEGGTLMFRVNGGEWQTSGEFTGLTDNTSYTVEAMYVAADGYIDSGIATITVTTDEKDLGLNIVETNSLAGISFSVRLIEPWAVRADIKFYEGQQPNHTLLNLADMKSYGVYAIAGSKFENANGATLEDLLRDSDTIHFEMSETAEDGKIYPINATQARFEFYDCLYTYHMSEAVYMVTYYEDAEGGLHFSRVRSKTLTEVIDGLKNIDEKEAKVYNSMKQMEATVMAYRATLSSSSLNAVYPAGQSITNSGITFGAGSESGAYKFGTQVSIKLIEPWGVKVSMRIVETSDTSVNIDYDAADDYGVIFFHDKAGEYADGMTVAQITAKDDAQVYSKSLGNVSIEDGRICAIYDQGIFTYEMDSTLYCMPYVVINGEYHYREIVVDDESYIDCAFDLNLIEKIGVFSEDINLSAEERAVYDAMMQMNADVVEYRAQFN